MAVHLPPVKLDAVCVLVGVAVVIAYLGRTCLVLNIILYAVISFYVSVLITRCKRVYVRACVRTLVRA